MFINQKILEGVVRGSIVVSIPACHAGDRGSIPRRGAFFPFFSSFSQTVVDAGKCACSMVYLWSNCTGMKTTATRGSEDNTLTGRPLYILFVFLSTHAATEFYPICINTVSLSFWIIHTDHSKV